MCGCFLGGNGYKEGYTNRATIAASKAHLSDKDNTQPDFKKVKEKEQTEEEKNEEKRKFRYDNYNHFEENPEESTETLFYNEKAGTARIVKTSKYGSIVTTDKSGASATYSIISPASVGSQVYIGPNYSTATVVSKDGAKEIRTTSATGVIVVYKGNKPVDRADLSKELNSYIPTRVSSMYNGVTKRTRASAKALKNANKHPNDFMSSSTTAKDYKEILNAVDSKTGTTTTNTQVPRGNENLYILKSQIVPLNCPACPTCDNSSSSNKNLEQERVDDTLKSSSMFSPMQGSYFGTSFGANMGADYNGSSDNEIEEAKEEKEDKKGGDRFPVPVLWNYTSFGM